MGERLQHADSWECACISAGHAYGVSISQRSSSPSSLFPIPAPCLRHKLAGDRERDKACEMAGNLPTPACRPLAILLTFPSPERIDASAFELL